MYQTKLSVYSGFEKHCGLTLFQYVCFVLLPLQYIVLCIELGTKDANEHNVKASGL